jgi:hypothetical protein
MKRLQVSLAIPSLRQATKQVQSHQLCVHSFGFFTARSVAAPSPARKHNDERNASVRPFPRSTSRLIGVADDGEGKSAEQTDDLHIQYITATSERETFPLTSSFRASIIPWL